MGFDKDYPNRKDKRQPYWTGGKRVSVLCRNHGACPWCATGRQHTHNTKLYDANEQIREFESRAMGSQDS